MSSKIGDIYQRFFKVYKSAHPRNTSEINQKKANEEWNEAKKKFSEQAEFIKYVEEQTEKYKQIVTTNFANSSIISFFGKVN